MGSGEEEVREGSGEMDFLESNWNDTRNCSMYENDYCEPIEDYEDRILSHLYPDKYKWMLIFAHFVVFIFGLVGNALVCVAVYRNTSMKTITNYFIANLAVADFMVILFCLIPTVLWDVTATWFLGPLLCKVVLYFQTVSVSVSVLTLTVISIERWYAICHPLDFIATTSRAKRLVLTIWIVSLLIDIPELIALETQPQLRVATIYFTKCSPNWSNEIDIFYTILRTVVLFAIPLAFMCFTNYQICRVLWSSAILGLDGSRRESNPHGSTVQSPASVQSLTPNLQGTSDRQDYAINVLNTRRKAAKMLIVVVLIFAFCNLPVHIYSIVVLVKNLPHKDYITYIVMVSHWLAYANSAVNPVIYNCMSGKFRREFSRAFRCNSDSNSVIPFTPKVRFSNRQQRANIIFV